MQEFTEIYPCQKCQHNEIFIITSHKKVIHTRSVEFVSFSLSFFLTLNTVVWFFYGLLVKDFYIYLPNILGFSFGLLQMVLYLIYKYWKKAPEEKKRPTTAKVATAKITLTVLIIWVLCHFDH
ncbi:hypothetical protein ACSBR1_024285 [Camellia fascicularis]